MRRVIKMVDTEILKLREIAEDHEKRIQELERLWHKLGEEPKIHKIGESEEGIKKLVKKTGVTEEKIMEIFDLEGDSLTLLKIIGENDKEKTKNATPIILLGYKYLFGKNELLTGEIKRNLAEHHVSPNNIPTYINEMIPSLLRRKGKFRSPKTTYRLTHLGEAEAKELIKEICQD